MRNDNFLQTRNTRTTKTTTLTNQLINDGQITLQNNLVFIAPLLIKNYAIKAHEAKAISIIIAAEFQQSYHQIILIATNIKNSAKPFFK